MADSADYIEGYNEGKRFNALIEQYVKGREMPSETERGFWASIIEGNTEDINVNVQLFIDLFYTIALEN